MAVTLAPFFVAPGKAVMLVGTTVAVNRRAEENAAVAVLTDNEDAVHPRRGLFASMDCLPTMDIPAKVAVSLRPAFNEAEMPLTPSDDAVTWMNPFEGINPAEDEEIASVLVCAVKGWFCVSTAKIVAI